MRRSFAFLKLSIVAVAALSLTSYPLTGSFAEDGEAATVQPKRLHTIPEDGFSAVMSIQLTPKVEKILNARASEDLVICVGGCPENRDIVVYAQPSNKAHTTNIHPAAASPDDEDEDSAAKVSTAPAKPAESEAATTGADAMPKAAEGPAQSNGETPATAAKVPAGEGRMQPTASPDQPPAEVPGSDAPADNEPAAPSSKPVDADAPPM